MHREMEITRHSGGGSPSRALDPVIAGLAARQHTMVARRQLLDLGFGEDAIDFRLGRARLHAVFTGAYSVAPGRPTKEGRWMAAVLATGPGAVLSHRAAAALHAIRPYAGCEVTVPRDRRPGGGIVVHRAAIEVDEITAVDGIPVTGISRTLLDLAAVVPYDQLERAARQAEITRATDTVSLTELLRRYPGRRGTRKLRALLDDTAIQAETRSELEDDFLTFVRAHGLPLPQTNVLVHGFLCDALWPEHRLVVELDSRAFHSHRRAFDDDRRRDRVLQHHGLRVVRLTKRHLTLEAAATARDLGALLAQ